MLLGELMKDLYPDMKIPFKVNEGDLLLVNVYLMLNLFNILLAGNEKKAKLNTTKYRPIIFYEKINNNFKFFPLSTKNKNRKKQIIFDLKNCKRINSCKEFNFKEESFVFLNTKTVNRNGKKTVIYKKFSLDLFLLDKFINNQNFFQNKKLDIGLEKNNPLEFFKICHNCDKDYVNSKVKEIYG
jgi:hypothetical protein